MVQLLVQEGAEINRPALGRIRRTPLQRAAEIGSFEMVQLCHNLGADINAPPARIGGGTALQLAAIGGFNGIVCYLLSHKAEVDAPSAKLDGMTALEGAAAHGRLATVSILLQAGAGSGGKDVAQFERAIAFAKENGSYPISRMLEAYLRSPAQHNSLGLPDLPDDFEDLINLHAYDS